jgi:hypothetical protein
LPSDATARTFCRSTVRSHSVSTGPGPAPPTSIDPDSSASLIDAPPDSFTSSTSISSPAALPRFSISRWSTTTLTSR